MTLILRESRPIFRAEFGGHLNVELMLPRGGEVPVEIVHLNEEGAGQLRGPFHGDEIEVGACCALRLSAHHLAQPIDLTAQVVHLRLDTCTGMLSATILVENWEDQRPVILPQLRAAFNRRSEVRVVPPDESPMRVQLAIAGSLRTVEAQVLDLSSAGMALRTTATFAQRLGPLSPVRVQVRLPNTTQAHTLDLMVRHVQLHNDPGKNCASLGLEAPFASALSPAWTRDVRRYIMERQREIARKVAESRLRGRGGV